MPTHNVDTSGFMNCIVSYTAKPAAIDPERDETLNILTDLVQLSAAPKTASTIKSTP